MVLPKQSKRVRRMFTVAGFLVLTVVASSGPLTASTSWASGVTVTSDSQALANDAFNYPLIFDTSLQTAMTALEGSGPTGSQAATTFYNSYVAATKEYGTTLLGAAQKYSDTSAADPAGAKNVYVDSFSTARATYFNELEVARNIVVSELSGVNDPAKDAFVNHYNAARDTYNNQLESVKNQIAAL